MKNVKFTDWQDLSLKKDIEDINRILKTKPVLNIFILVEIILGILTVGFSAIAIISSNESYFDWIIALIIISISTPFIIIVVIEMQKYYKDKEKITKKKLEIKPYVDIFDNKVTNYIMMATSMIDNLHSDSEHTSTEVRYFILSEASYLINKCIFELHRTGPFLEQIFTDNKENKVSPSRLHMAIKLMIKLRFDMKVDLSTIPQSKKDIVIENYLKVINEKSDKQILVFIENLQKHSLLNNIKWLKW